MRHLLIFLTAGLSLAQAPIPVVIDGGTIKPPAADVLTALGIGAVPFSVADGGTGASTLTGLLQGNGTSAITGISNSSTIGQALRVTGASTYAWGALDLADTDAITGTLPVANGGTGAATLTSNNVLLGNGTSAVQFVAPGTTGNVLTSNGTTWQSTAPAASGKSYIVLTHPDLADGTGATLGSNATLITYGRPSFSNSADQASNYVEYYFSVPSDIDTSVAMRAIFKFTLGGADTGTHRYVLSMANVAASADPTSASLTNTINLDFAGDGSGASGDLESVGYTTLTSWASSLTADNVIRIRLARDGNDASDASTVNSSAIELKLEYDPL